MNKVNAEDAKEFLSPYKIGLIATLDDEGDPHITMISTLMNKGEDKMMIGEFIVGLSKEYIHKRPDTGFIIMGLKRDFWTGKMRFLEETTIAGDDFNLYNSMPLYRYNTYFGVNKVHYADLLEITEKKPLDMGGIIKNALKVLFLKGKYAGDKKKIVMKPWARKLTAKIDTLMFIGYVGEDGFPKLVPIIQGQSASTSRIVFTSKPYDEKLKDLKDGVRVAVFAANLSMETVLFKGVFHGFDKSDLGYVEIDKIYNGMPPKHGYVYPYQGQNKVDFSKEQE